MQKTLDQLIKSLFANGEQGFAYDPNNLTTMFQDAAGTIPVTAAGQAVGLMLDKGKGLTGSQNLLPQSSFSEGTTGWTLQSGWTESSDKVSNTTGGTSLISPLTLEVGKLYRVTLNTHMTSEAGMLSIRSGVNADTQMVRESVNGIQTFLLRPTLITDALRFQSVSWMGDIYSVQVVEILGNHAHQTTSSMRPLLAASPQRLDYDTVDDKLITDLSAQLTGCTVVRAVPNVGTQILTNQTIPTPYNDNTDHCGLIVINRALTATETSQITKLFNKAAGV